MDCLKGLPCGVFLVFVVVVGVFFLSPSPEFWEWDGEAGFQLPVETYLD